MRELIAAIIFMLGATMATADSSPPRGELHRESLGELRVEKQAAESDRDASALEIARIWFSELVGGDADSALRVSSVPFTFDSRNVIETMPELKEAYDKVVENKGARDIEPTSLSIDASSPEKVVVLIMIEDEAVRVDVRPGDVFRIVGFRD